ncbi:alkene reductase [Longibacter sp.]|uniref:alkene reductase n=1 Tax=Longibacter sp. TaxID=2045415 RepID=UPI003EC0E7EB
MSSPLFRPLETGDLSLPHRVLMAPLTRNRAGEGNVPGEMNAEYYRQRASAGLIVTEATQVAPRGQGYPRTPGIHSDEQVGGWKLVTNAVHEADGRIVLQLWHVGRISHSSYHDGEKPVAPSAIAAEGETLTANMEMEPFETPYALETDEVADVVEQYRRGAERALEAGFDGVEIHGANGYLIDQFLRSGSNQRTDRYGGSLENRLRFLQDVVDAVVDVWGAERVGLRLSPLSGFNSMSDNTPVDTFTAAARAADEAGLAYLHLVEPSDPKPPVRGDGKVREVFSAIRDAFEGVLIANGNYDAETANDAITSGYADAVTFGRSFLANPDLPRRLRDGLPVNVPDESTFYNGGAKGYTDYPTWDEIQNGAAEVETIDQLAELAARG